MTKLIFLAAAVSMTAMVPSASMAMANPASVFCGKMGGKSVTAKLPSGDEIGLCYITKNKIVEEWTLYRMFDGKKPTPKMNPFLAR